MKYRVVWSPDAERDLEEILRVAPRTDDVVTAARAIDAALLVDPIEFGESRYESVRVGFARPLGVEYEVLDDVRTVIVHGVWRIRGQ